MVFRFIGAIVVFVGAVCMSYAMTVHIAAITSGNVIFRTFLCSCTFSTVFYIVIYMAWFFTKDANKI